MFGEGYKLCSSSICSNNYYQMGQIEDEAMGDARGSQEMRNIQTNFNQLKWTEATSA
jgi:hypothetical protein